VDEEPGSLEAVTEGARIQTFLIADVRGYTLFTQQRGDEAAAKLAAKFARIARETVQARGGSVIELRGDEALAVFSSARQAVAGAVDLQERFVEETIDDPELPIPVGIGLDAGEAVPFEGGYRGGALNLAARLCGQARPGEILASRGVTHLAGRVEGVRYVDRGRMQLKNLTEPVELVRIVPEGGDPAERLRATLPPTAPARRRSGAKIAIAAVVAIAITVGATIFLLPGGALPTIAAGAVGFLSLSGELEGTVGVGELPRGLARGAGSLWVADQGSQSLLQVNPSTFQVEERIPVGVGPTGVAIAAGLVWVANTDERTVSVVDPEAHRVVQTVVVGNGPVGIVADGEHVWVANSVDATVSEIDATDGTVSGTYRVGERPVALAAASGAVWVANELSGTVSRVVSREGETQSIAVGRGPAAVAFGAGALWVANAEDGTVTRIDPETGSVTGTEQVGGSPVAVAAGPDGVWVANAQDGTILRIDPATGRVSSTLEVGNEPRVLVWTETGVWVGVEASSTTHRGGTLRVVSETGIESIDPAAANLVGLPVIAASYDGLVTYRRAGGAAGLAVVPDLAVAVPAPTDDGRSYTFRIREGIRFSNGHVLTPNDVAATFQRVLTGRTSYGRFLLPELAGASTCTPKDPEACDLSRGVVADEAGGTVTFHLVRAAPDFLAILATPYFAILPAGTPLDLEGVPAPATGPYLISDAGEDGSVVLERNPEFREWSADAQPAGFADRIEVVIGVDPQEQVARVERGEADLGLDGVPPELVEELDRRASDQLVRSPFFAIGAVTLNTATHPFDRVDARRAVAYALDRGELARIYAETTGFPLENPVTCQVIPPGIPGYAPYCPFTRPGADVQGAWAGPDLTRARELVQRSRTAGAEVVVAMAPALQATAEQVAATLSDLGYRVRVRIVDTEQLVVSPDLMPPDADASFIGWVQDYPSAAQFIVPLLGCTSPDGTPAIEDVGEFSLNLSNFCNPGIDRRVQRALDLQPTDPYASARAFEAIEHDLVDLAPLIPYETGIQISIVSKRASNVEFNPQLGVILTQVWVR
jgi:ABC-type transport system substrate-binding protein/class 3 adenylate cyclase